MRSVADDLRNELRKETASLPWEERLAQTFLLGEEGLRRFCEANGYDRETGLRMLQRQRQAGQTPSKCISELIG